MTNPKNFVIPNKLPESFVFRTTITLSYEHHLELIQALEAAPSRARAIRELMIKGHQAFKDELAMEAASES